MYGATQVDLENGSYRLGLFQVSVVFGFMSGLFLVWFNYGILVFGSIRVQVRCI